MKKIIVLAAVALSMVVAPIFAGDVSLSGQVEFGASTDFDENYSVDVDDVKITFKGEADDYTTVGITMEMQDAFVQGTNVSTSDDIETSAVTSYVLLQDGEFYVKTDVTGALELDLPLSVAFYSGWNDDIGAKSYDTGGLVRAEEIQDRDNEQNWVMGTYLGLGDITVQAALYPNYYDVDGGTDYTIDFFSNMFVGAYGTVADAKFELYYCANDVDGMNSIGGSAAYTVGMEGMSVMPMITFALDMEDASGDMEDGDTNIGFGTAFEMDDMLLVTAGLGFGQSGTEDTDATMEVGFDVQYYLNDVVTFFGAIDFADVLSDADAEWDLYNEDGFDCTGGYQVGATIALGSCNYYVGYEGGDIDTELCGTDFYQGAFTAINVKF
jgi:hypothetical protein